MCVWLTVTVSSLAGDTLCGAVVFCDYLPYDVPQEKTSCNVRVWGLFWALNCTFVSSFAAYIVMVTGALTLFRGMCNIISKVRFPGPCQPFYTQITPMWQKQPLFRYLDGKAAEWGEWGIVSPMLAFCACILCLQKQLCENVSFKTTLFL